MPEIVADKPDPLCCFSRADSRKLKTLGPDLWLPRARGLAKGEGGDAQLKIKAG